MIGFVNRFAYARRKLISIFVLTMKHPDSLIDILTVSGIRTNGRKCLVEGIKTNVLIIKNFIVGSVSGINNFDWIEEGSFL